MRERLRVFQATEACGSSRTAWSEMADKGAKVPELEAISGWSMDTGAENLETAVATSRPLAKPITL